MKLVLAEKPSVAQSLAKVLGANKRCDGYLEGNGYIVSWCIGHLVELSPPEAYDETYAKWRLADLPILPAVWKYQVSSSTKKQFGILKKLMKRDDVESLVCATDAGREGELIFRLVYHQAGCKKPFERLWISSMEDQAIKEGFTNLEPSTKYDALYEAALCRERADWIVGMNATRLFSCLYHQTLNIGRVMTPTLAMVVMRDAEIAAFKPKPFYTVQLGLNGITAASRRFDEKGDAQQLLAKCKETMKAVIKSMDRKEKTERAPLLYDLTSLQRDANRILGFTAQQTLDYSFAYVAGWSHGKETPELKASLDKIRKTASEMITEIDEHLAVLQKEYAWAHLTADDVKNIECIGSEYMPHSRMAEHTFSCEIVGEPMTLKLTVSQHDDGEGFTINTEGKDMWLHRPSEKYITFCAAPFTRL